MGQGLYDLLGWGVLNPPLLLHPPEPDGTQWIDDDLGDALEHLHLKHTDEAEPEYLVIPLAVSDSLLQDWWKLPPLPDWCPRVKPRTARRIQMPRKGYLDTALMRPHDLTQTWQEAQRIYAKFGLQLPDASLILLNDWD
jgi:hypothetical protein